MKVGGVNLAHLNKTSMNNKILKFELCHSKFLHTKNNEGEQDNKMTKNHWENWGKQHIRHGSRCEGMNLAHVKKKSMKLWALSFTTAGSCTQKMAKGVKQHDNQVESLRRMKKTIKISKITKKIAKIAKWPKSLKRTSKTSQKT